MKKLRKLFGASRNKIELLLAFNSIRERRDLCSALEGNLRERNHLVDQRTHHVLVFVEGDNVLDRRLQAIKKNT